MRNSNDYNMERVLELVQELKLNSISITPDINLNSSIQPGMSKIGGKPDLPTDFNWYTFEAESMDDEIVKERSLSFLAQFNLGELNQYDIDNRLPKTGMLYFFYEMESFRWGFSPDDKGSAKVFYYDGNLNELVSTDIPKDIKEEYLVPEIAITFKERPSAPDFEELFNDNLNFDLWDEYDEYLVENDYRNDEDEVNIKLLGYSDNEQGDMTGECQLVTNGIEADSSAYQSDKGKELLKTKDQWKLLFQIDSIQRDDIELLFGDVGKLYFYIKEDDLKKKNFNNTWMILQCG